MKKSRTIKPDPLFWKATDVDFLKGLLARYGKRYRFLAEADRQEALHFLCALCMELEPLFACHGANLEHMRRMPVRQRRAVHLVCTNPDWSWVLNNMHDTAH